VAEQSFVQKLAAGPLQLVLDRGVQQSESARGLCRRLEGKTLQISTGVPAFDSFLVVENERLEIKSGQIEDPDAVLKGTPLNLARMSAGDPQALIREGDVKLSGDPDVAEDFQALLYLTRPDLEEELAQLTGDVVAHEVGKGVRMLGDWLAGAERTLTRSMGEYLSEETRAVVTDSEIDQFCAAVDTLATDVDRLEARFQLLRESLAGDSPANETA
jgi:ubiquinone biosynthesis protein UbiJ